MTMKPRLMYWWLFFSIFTLWALNGKAQSNVPSIPGWLDKYEYVDASGNTVSKNVDDAGNLVKYYLGFEDANNAWSDLSLQKYIEKWEGQSRIPDKWVLNRNIKSMIFL